MKRESHDELALRIDQATSELPTLTLLRHVTSGEYYRVRDVALDEGTLEPVVIYTPENRSDVRFVRPLKAMLARFVVD